LNAHEPAQKCSLVRTLSSDWLAERVPLNDPAQAAAAIASSLPDQPARPALPQILDSVLQMPSAREARVNPLIYALHNLAHIELNAIELYLDTAARFSTIGFGRPFVDDLMSIALDESR
jgi:uncharacterized ferritin-like protein (DUF455 family)